MQFKIKLKIVHRRRFLHNNAGRNLIYYCYTLIKSRMARLEHTLLATADVSNMQSRDMARRHWVNACRRQFYLMPFLEAGKQSCLTATH
jgi:hypothetical protein